MNDEKALRQYWFVIKELAGREIKRKYTRSYLGIVWSVLNPLLMMIVISAIFSAIFKRAIDNFPVYYMTGLILYNMFHEATDNAMSSLVDNKLLLIKVKFPMFVFPLSRAVTALLNLEYTCIAYVLILVFFEVELSATLLLFPVIVLLLFLFSVGIGCMLSVAYVFFGDIKHLYGVLMVLVMYCSALFYPVEMVTGIARQIIEWNPLYSFVASARSCMIYGTIPNGDYILKMLVWSIGMFILGICVFHDNKHKIMQKL